MRLPRMSCLACAVTTALVLQPAPAGAQAGKDQFVQGLIDVSVAMPGVYGDEGAQILAAIARMRTGLDRWDASIANVERAFASEIGNADPAAASNMRAALALVYLDRARGADALQVLEAARQAAAPSVEVHGLRALAYREEGDAAHAAEARTAAWRLAPDDPTQVYLASNNVPAGGPLDPALTQALMQAGERLASEAPAPARFQHVALLEDGSVPGPILPLAAYREGFRLLGGGQYAGALASLQQAALTDPLNTDPVLSSALVVRAVADYRAARLEPAIEALSMAAGANPGSSELQRLLGLVFWANQNYERSVSSFESAVASDAANERAWLGLAGVLEDSGQIMKAEEVLRRALEAVPGSVQASWTLGRLYQVQGAARDAEALPLFEAARAASPLAGRGIIDGAIGRIHNTRLELPEAAAAMRRRLDAEPNNGAAHRELGDVFWARGLADRALAEYVAALLLDPMDADALAKLAQVYISKERFEPARAVLERAVALKPRFTGAHYALATVLAHLGEHDASRKELETYRGLQAADAEDVRRAYAVNLLKLEAGVHAREGRFDRAAGLWERVVAQEPDVAANHLALARLLERAGRAAEAAASYERALELNPAAGIYTALAALYERLGRADESEGVLRRLERFRTERLREPAR